MRKFVVIMTCMLACFILLAGCSDKEKDSQQNQNVHNAVEIDDRDLESDITPESETESSPDSAYTLPDGITYEFKDPDNADGIVVTPKK